MIPHPACMKFKHGAASRRSLQFLLQCCLLVVFTACHTLPPSMTQHMTDERSAASYMRWLQEADSETLAAERDRLQSLTSGTAASFVARAQLALLDSRSGKAGSSAPLSVLVNEKATTAAATLSLQERDYLAFLQLWQGRLQDAANLADLQRRRSADAQEKAALQEQIEQLESKLDAFTRIEQELMQRERAQVPK